MSISEIPGHLFGWRYDIAEQEFARLQRHFVRFVARAPIAADGPPIWEYAKKVNGGRHLPTWYQETGDCVSMGGVNAGQYLHCYEIARRFEEEKFRLWFPPYIYATSRTEPDCGNGRLGRGAGSTGAWAITAMKNHGILFSDDQGCPDYSGGLADNWGYRGAPAEFKKLAADNPVRSAARLRTVEDVRASLLAYEPVTYAIVWRYGTGARDIDGIRCLVRGRGGGGHQVALIAWRDKPFPAAFLLNSWGRGVHRGADNGEPEGGAWLLARDLEKDLASSYSEVYGISTFEGEPGEPDYGIL